MSDSTATRPSANLVVQQTGQNIPLSEVSLTIGRVQDNDIVLNDADISRHHASLNWNGQQYVIQDLGSTNGTFVNGVRINAPQALKNGDMLGLGNLTCSFQAAGVVGGPGDAAATQSRPVPQPPLYVSSPVAVMPRSRKGTPWWMLGLGAGLVVLLLIAALAALLLFRPKGNLIVSITAPSNGSQVRVGEELLVMAVANDPAGVVRVELWVDDVQTDMIAVPEPKGRPSLPVRFRWTPAEAGNHTLAVRAYNSAGKTGDPDEVLVNAAGSLVVATRQPDVTAESMPVSNSTSAVCTSDADFVADVTIPDFTQVAPGQRLDKIWRLRNSSDCVWGAGYQFSFISGELMNASPTQSVPSTPAGETADIQVTMYAPDAPGTYEGRWRMQDASGQFFGTPVFIKITVVSSEPPAPTPTTEIALSDTPVSPGACVAAIDFRADNTSIPAGDSTTLRWDVECVREVYLGNEGVTGHGTRNVSPPSTRSYTLRVVKNDGTSEERQVTVNVQAAASPISANIIFHSYDQTSGWVTLEIANAPTGARLEGATTRIFNVNNNTVYYQGHSDTPFRPNPTSDTLQESLLPGGARYLRYRLTGTPSGVRCRANITLFTGNEKTGSQSTGHLEFDLPAAGPPQPQLSASISYHSYDQSSGWVTFRVQNGPGSGTFESASATIVNRNTSANYYGPGQSDTPFRPAPTSNALESSLAPGGTKYVRYKLNGNPSGVPCRATITLYTGNGATGLQVAKSVIFDLPAAAPPAPVNVNVVYDSYSSASGWVTFRVSNAPGAPTLESSYVTIVNDSTNQYYYGPAESDKPFRPNPASGTLEESLPPGTMRYISFNLAGNPSGVPCRAIITLYTGNGKTGQYAQKTVHFSTSVDFNVTYHSYDASSGWVTFRIQNGADTQTLECVEARVVNDNNNSIVYYPLAFSDTPFRSNPTSNALESNLPPGITKYLRYRLNGAPTGVKCWASIIAYVGDGKSGASRNRNVIFDLP